MPSTNDDWFTCPVCGEAVQADALACPGCGSDDETGWSEEAAYDDLDLPDTAEENQSITRVRSRWVLTIGFALLLLAGLLLTRSCVGW
jgi:uncharacterized membrane protein YvbJ